MSIKVTFQIPPGSPVNADKLSTRTYPTDDTGIVQDKVTQELLALGFTDAEVVSRLCVKSLLIFMALREGNTHLAAAKLEIV